jgi:Ca2+-binding RTX toxin-like protein
MTTLYGSAANNNLVGTGGADVIYGNAGADILNGYYGDDSLFGGSGNDRLRGGPGSDRLTGDEGADRFVFYRADGYDQITDYQQGVDRLEFRSISGREITWTAVDGGVTVRYGGLGGQAPDHGEIFIAGVSALGSSDFIFS